MKMIKMRELKELALDHIEALGPVEFVCISLFIGCISVIAAIGCDVTRF